MEEAVKEELKDLMTKAIKLGTITGAQQMQTCVLRRLLVEKNAGRITNPVIINFFIDDMILELSKIKQT